MSTRPVYKALWLSGMEKIDPKEWNKLAKPPETPLFEWEWLFCMESSQSISPKTGWYPLHLTLWKEKTLVAAAPCYIKIHSEGEFIYDEIWAQVAQKLKVPYYPKLIGMSPVTPITGYSFLIKDGENKNKITGLLIKIIENFCIKNKLSGYSFLFCDYNFAENLKKSGMTKWLHQGFIWKNKKFKNFSDYLTLFKTNQRRNIKREISAMKKNGIRIETFYGREIPENFIPVMYEYYKKTNDQHGIWGCRYLNEKFFKKAYEKYKHRILIVGAFEKKAKKPVGMSFLIRKNNWLLGRYWGCEKEIKYLHFNVCYYEPIRWAIENKVEYFDPGMGGLHKALRGFESVPTISLHRFINPVLNNTVKYHINKINNAELAEIEELNRKMPFARQNIKAL